MSKMWKKKTGATQIMTTTIRVTETLRDDLNLLKQLGHHDNIDVLIRMLLEKRGYNKEFFERVREKVSE